jgi:hypothetical protein
LINQVRGFLLERGIAFAKGPANLRSQMPTLLEDAEQNLTPRMRLLLDHLWQEWKELEDNITQISDEIERIATNDASCRRRGRSPESGRWFRRRW